MQNFGFRYKVLTKAFLKQSYANLWKSDFIKKLKQQKLTTLIKLWAYLTKILKNIYKFIYLLINDYIK